MLKKDVETPRNTLRPLDMNPNSGGNSSADLARKTSWKDNKKFKISEEILRKTNCRDGFSCLSGDHTCLCDVEDDIAGVVCFVKCTDKGCPHMVSQGFLGTACTCPARVEIFKRYRR